MKTSFIRVVLISVLAGLFAASLGLASAGNLGYLRASASAKATVSPHTSEDDETVKPEPEEGDTASREAQCRTAAGMSTVADGADASDATVAEGTTDEAKKRGLDRAIEVVLANCIKNPQAPGLVNALRHLVENRERHMALEAEKAARRASREARKAAHGAASGHAKGHGRAGRA